MRHELKTWPKYFLALQKGSKNFEIRTNDRGFNVGDTLILREYDPKSETYTGQSIEREVVYIAQGVFGLPENVCVMGLETESLQSQLTAVTAERDAYRKLLESSLAVTGRAIDVWCGGAEDLGLDDDLSTLRNQIRKAINPVDEHQEFEF